MNPYDPITERSHWLRWQMSDEVSQGGPMTEIERLDAVAAWHRAKASCDVEMLIASWWPAWRAMWTMVGIHVAISAIPIDSLARLLAE